MRFNRRLFSVIIKIINGKNIFKKLASNYISNSACWSCFINFYANYDFLAEAINAISTDPKFGVKSAVPPVTTVVDYSSPNVAKEMAVHHIRSTVIGDAVVRVLEFLGNKVIRANHIGDWGTQFGMLIAYLEKKENEESG